MAGVPGLGALRRSQLSAPSSPSAGQNLLYPKSDGKWYSKDASGVETLVGPVTNVVTTDAAQTLLLKTLNAPKIIGGLLDTSGNTLLGFTSPASAVNFVNAGSAATGNDPGFGASGADADVSLALQNKGLGTVKLGFPLTTNVEPATSGVNYVRQVGSATGSPVSVGAGGSDANVGLNLFSKGSGAVTANGVAVVTTDDNRLAPPGTIQMYAGSTAPPGWLLCNTNTAISRTTYAALFAAIGTTYGVGDGSTTFNLPNFNDRFPIGSGTKALGATGGGSTKTIGATNLPNHTHSVGTLGATTTGSTHQHTIDVGNATPGTVNNTLQRGSVSTPVSSIVAPVQVSGSHNHDVTGNTGNPNGTVGVAMDVMNPWLSINFIIKT